MQRVLLKKNQRLNYFGLSQKKTTGEKMTNVRIQ